MTEDNEKYWLLPAKVDYLGTQGLDRLLIRFGDVKTIYEAPAKDILSVEGVYPGMLEKFVEVRSKFDPDEEAEKLAKAGIGFVSRENPLYPKRLKEISSPPNVLFFYGHLPENDKPAVAVIGSRGCSSYGREISRSFAAEFGRLGIDVISGMAAGVDGYSHRGALEGGGKTYAVLGCGVDFCYPAANRDIYDAIPEKGGILSEFYPGTQPIACNFPMRNRIISALSDGILVIEAREKSGTGITVEMGLEQGKDIYAIPGRIGDKLSDGCNKLIRQGARLVQSPADIVAEMAHSYGYLVDRKGCADQAGRKRRKKGLTSDQIMVLDLLDLKPKSITELSMKTGLDSAEIMAVLTILEIKGYAHAVGDGSYTGNFQS